MNKLAKTLLAPLLLVVSIGSLSGCSTGINGETIMGRAESPLWFRSASRATIIAHFSEQCLSYGYEKGTDEFRDCLRETETESRARASSRANAAFKSIQSNQPKNCTSTITGGSGIYTGTTTCY